MLMHIIRRWFIAFLNLMGFVMLSKIKQTKKSNGVHFNKPIEFDSNTKIHLFEQARK